MPCKSSGRFYAPPGISSPSIIDKRDNVNTGYPEISSATATTKNYQLIQFLFKCKSHCRPILEQLRLRKIIKFVAVSLMPDFKAKMY